MQIRMYKGYIIFVYKVVHRGGVGFACICKVCYNRDIAVFSATHRETKNEHI